MKKNIFKQKNYGLCNNVKIVGIYVNSFIKDVFCECNVWGRRKKHPTFFICKLCWANLCCFFLFSWTKPWPFSILFFMLGYEHVKTICKSVIFSFHFHIFYSQTVNYYTQNYTFKNHVLLEILFLFFICAVFRHRYSFFRLAKKKQDTAV